MLNRQWQFGAAGRLPSTARHPKVTMHNQGLRILLPYMRPWHRALWIGAIYALIGASASAFSPTLLGWGIDALRNGIDASTLIRYSLGLIGLSATLAIFRYLLRMLTGEIAAGVSYQMSKDFFHHVLTFDQQTRQEYGTGDLLSRATNDFIYIWRFYSAGFQMSIHSIFLLIIGSSLMALSSPLLAGIVVGLLLISIVAQVWLGRMLEQSFVQVEREIARISGFVQEHLNAARMLTAYSQEKPVGQAFRAANQLYVEKNLKFVIQSGFISPLPSLMVRLAATLIVLLGGLMVIRQQMSVGEYVQFIVYLGLLNSATRQITGAFERLQQGSAAAARIGEVLQRIPRIRDTDRSLAPTLQGHLCFEDVGVWSEEQKRWVLRHINLDLPVGSTLGIVGPTGSGKSMLISLIGRIYEPSEGRILLDGHNLRALKLTTLRDAVVYVPQETLLFSMALRKNIAIGNLTKGDEEILKAMQRARLSNDLSQLPQGLDTVVGERGATLSGGQKQRTALARALVRNPQLLILDDSLASVDVKTSAEIISELRKAQSTCTTLIVSQRMAAVEHANEIIVLDEGHIAERGTHEQLMTMNGQYAAMVRREQEQAAQAESDGMTR